MRRVIPVLAFVCAALVPVAVTAQTRPQPPATQPVRRPTPPPNKPPIGVRAYGFYEFDSLSASQTFDAVTGGSTLNGFGGGVEFTNLWRNVFARATFAHASKDGERVFVNNGTVFPLGIPLTVGMTPIELAGGWRDKLDRRGLYNLYAGAGAVFLIYSETSTGGTSDDNTSKTFGGYSIFGGVDRGFHKNLFVGFEAQYRGVPNAIGTAGVSQIYNETNLGGFALRVMFGFKK
jgi:hypothetical protein